MPTLYKGPKIAVVVHPYNNGGSCRLTLWRMSNPYAAVYPSISDETGIEISTFLPIPSRGLMSVLPHPFYQSCFTPGTARADLRQHLPCTSDVPSPGYGEYTVRFYQAVHMAMSSVESSNPVVSQPVRCFAPVRQLVDQMYQLGAC
ncbi:uncharacterized protein AKAW2_50235A [Aspergillus luchuensis]|uniref:Uncharacterized protein n=1 Tax=Aspergillus kawachii TaxID=1069201 RepID=A0A7R7WCD1_ASPKA|nr:uncharacterized protein AKAW2_50235A [Aspergillus luchuensis]BCR99893.1 hypothetical protein AKAW2_50235A [Aspergillus luchuensis]